MPEKRIHKSSTDKKICGVCGGIAEHFGIDSTWVRIAFCIAALCASVGVWPYIICALVFPNDTEINQQKTVNSDVNYIPAEPVSEPEIRCVACGYILNPGDKFCPQCGQPVNTYNPNN